MKRLTIALTLLVAACTVGEKAQNLRMGMTPAEVVAVMGQPDGQAQNGNQLGYQYTNRLISGWSYARADYQMFFIDGRLSSWGPATVRQNAAPTSTLLFVPVR